MNETHNETEWRCDCCGTWIREGEACPHGTTEAMYDLPTTLERR